MGDKVEAQRVADERVPHQAHTKEPPWELRPIHRESGPDAEPRRDRQDRQGVTLEARKRRRQTLLISQ